MQQRRPRLGDVLDDYCPRERRVTNHVVVAMIEDQVKQTRCTTCDGDHDYKQARTPSPRKPKTVAAIHDGAEAFEAKPVLAAPVRAVDVPAASAEEPVALESDDTFEPAIPAPVGELGPPQPVAVAAAADAAMAAEPPAPQMQPGDDEGPVHRRLIRATLPRPEGHVPERKEPEFTIRQQGARGGGHEVDGNRVGYRPKGHRQGGFGQGGGHSRFGGQRHGSGQQPQRQGARPAQNGQRGGRPDGMGNTRGQRGPGSGRRRGGR